ncbi:MAG: carboxypeptidase M32 [Rhodothermales bacterium]
MKHAIDTLKTSLGQVKDLETSANLLEWDQETYMPEGAAGARAHQIATLRKLAHELFTRDEMGELLEAAGQELNGADPLSTEAALVRVAGRDFERALKLPAELVADFARAVSHGKNAWKEARESDTFATFAPHLQTLVDLNIQKAEAYGYTDKIYDAMLDQYEPGMKTAEVESVFADLREQLVPIVQQIQAASQPADPFLHIKYDHQKQWDFGLDVIRDFGYNFKCGRQDVSAHPFTTSFSITDVRLTTRVNEHFFPTALFGTLHEAGHGLYEQGVALELDRTPLAEGTSLGMHESQSRLWENLVGRSKPFWEHYYPKLQRIFPDQLKAISLDTFYPALNKVNPSLIRVEADEVTYNLHIMLRFEIENALVDGKVKVNDLPELWRTKMGEYLGVTPENDADGVLQDIHWSLGVFGYFPTYALGNLMSTQLFDQASKDLPNLDDQMRNGQFAELLSWLQTNIHQYGRKLEAGEILERVTGERLNSESWLRYVKQKYSAIYGF